MMAAAPLKNVWLPFPVSKKQFIIHAYKVYYHITVGLYQFYQVLDYVTIISLQI